MTFQVGILDYLRAEGLTVVEVNGWQTRGRPEADDPFSPHGSLNHHTAGAATGSAPSLGICINGRPDLAGPLCQVLQSRQKDVNGLYVVYLIACGRANHAGAGTWSGLSQNHSVWGLEIEHTGSSTEPFSQAQRDTAVRVHTAFAKHSKFTAAKTCQHYEWTSRKQDFVRALLDPNQFRDSIAARLAPAPLPAPTPAPEEEQMFVSCPTPWIPAWPDGREPFLKAGPGPVANSVNIVSFNGAPLERVPVLQRALDGSLFWGDGGGWQEGKKDAKGRVTDSSVFGIWWMRTVWDTLGGPDMLALYDNETRVVLGTSGGGTYSIARK